MRILSVINQKGGCGKTTTAINLSACLALSGRKVLLVDMDPQAHATLGLNAAKQKPEVDLRTAMLKIPEESIRLARCRVPVQTHLDMIPSSLALAALEQELSAADQRENRLRMLLAQGGNAYNYVLIDAPPNLGILTINALAASSEVLIPVETSMFSLHGLRRLFQVIDLVQERVQVNLTMHILLTMYNPRTRLAKEINAELEERFKDRLLRTKIRQNIHLKEAASFGLPVAMFEKNCLGCWDYQSLAEEILAMEKQLLASNETSEVQVVEQAVHHEPQLSDEDGYREIVFHMEAPHAKNVYVVGEFNKWHIGPTAILERDHQGVWKKRFRLPPGTYQYKFYVDGQWVLDPNNPFHIVTENGLVNSLVKIK